MDRHDHFERRPLAARPDFQMPANRTKPVAHARNADAKNFVIRASVQDGGHAAAEVLDQEPDVIVDPLEPEDCFPAA
jgi:hypothetical protein